MRAHLLPFSFLLAYSAFAAPIVFNANGTLSGGGSFSGTVTIDTATGDVLAANISANVFRTFTFSHNVGGIPNYANSGLYVIAGNAVDNGYPVALVGLPVASVVGYGGGAVSVASNIILENATSYGISNGSLAFNSQSQNAGVTTSVFNATGNVAGGGTFSGNVSIDVTNGNVVASTLTATIPYTYILSAGVGGVPNYANSGLFVIVVNEAAGGYPVALFGLAKANLVGFTGAPIVTASNLNLADGTRFDVLSGSLSAPVPEPSMFAGVAVALLGFAALRRRR